jgi:hypothetical protein
LYEARTTADGNRKERERGRERGREKRKASNPVSWGVTYLPNTSTVKKI